MLNKRQRATRLDIGEAIKTGVPIFGKFLYAPDACAAAYADFVINYKRRDICLYVYDGVPRRVFQA